MTERTLWSDVCSLSGLMAGWLRVRTNNGAAGGDGVTIGKFQSRHTANLKSLSQQLIDGTYRPGDFRRVDIPKRKGGVRTLMVPTIRDRIVHTTIAEALKPILEPMFEESSFAYRPGRSVQQAVRKVEMWRNQGYRHVIEADIVRYFDNIRHDLLLNKLERAIGAHRESDLVLSLIAESLVHQGIELGADSVGLAQGSPLSPILANLYLDALDEAMDGKGVRIVRFADDFVVLCKSQKHAEAALSEVRSVLAAHGLSLHEDSTKILDFDQEFDFVGHLFVRSLAVKKTYDDDVDQKPETLVDPTDEPQTGSPELPLNTRYDRGLGVLYLTDPSRRLGLRNDSFSIRSGNDHEIAAISHLRIGRIEVGPKVVVDPDILRHCLATETDIVFVDGYGDRKAQLIRTEHEAGELQLRQAKTLLDQTSRTELACKLVDARIRNQRTQLFRLNRTRDDAVIRAALKDMGRLLRKISVTASLNQLRGFEGAAAAIYWPALARMTDGSSTPFRRSRPATDPLNAAINYLTALLERDIRTALNCADLHVGFGILHAADDYSEAAIYDLMEPFRAPLTEGLAAYLFNSSRLKLEMFGDPYDRGIRIEQAGRTAIIKGYEQAVAKRVNITGRKGKLAWRPMMQRQAYDLAKAFRTGNLDQFQPYLMEA